MNDVHCLPDILARSAERHGSWTALVFTKDGQRFAWTYAQVEEKASRIARVLAGQGYAKGERIVLWAPNGPDWVTTFFGILTLGAIVVPLDVQSGSDFIERVLDRSEPRLILTTDELRPRLPKAEAPVITLDELAELIPDVGSPLCPVEQDDIAELVFTSGTTGAPKGVVLTHRNILADLEAAYTFVPPVARYCMLSLLPLSHMLEQIAELFFVLSVGARVVYVDSLQPATIFKAMQDERVNGLVVVPQILALFMSGIEREIRKRGGEQRWRSAHRIAPYLPIPVRRRLFRQVHDRLGGCLEFIVCGGAHLDPALAQRWENLGVKVRIGYGATEASPIITLSPMAQRKSNLRSVGLAIPCCQVMIAENGEVLVRGTNITGGYWQDEEATRAAFADGWYRTGDLGYLDKNGLLYLRGRLKNMIVLGNGMNVYPEDIESVLREHPLVTNAIVIGRRRDEDVVVHAVLVVSRGAEGTVDVGAIIKTANARLAPHQRIRDWTLWPADVELPQTHTFKPKRAEILRLLDEGIGRPAAD